MFPFSFYLALPYLYAKCLYVLRLHTDTHKSDKEMIDMESEVNEVIRERVSITLPSEVLVWLDKKIEARTYANRSHAIEVLILEAMKAERRE
jgi:hypothetical protein